MHRHREHIPAALTKAEQAHEVAQATTLLGRIEGLIQDCRAISQKAQRARQWQAAVSALRELRGCLELLGKLSGELQRPDVTDDHRDPNAIPPPIEFIVVRAEPKDIRGNVIKTEEQKVLAVAPTEPQTIELEKEVTVTPIARP